MSARSDRPLSRKLTAWTALVFCLAIAALGSLQSCGPVNISDIFTATLTPSGTSPYTATFTLTPSDTPTPIPPTETPTSTATFTATATDTSTPTATLTNTAGPSPTGTLTPTITRTPTITLTPSITRTPSRTPTPSKTPTITLTPLPPPPLVSIALPGLLSRVISPIKAEIYAMPGDDGMVRVELIGEDGRLIVRQAVDFREYKHKSIAFYPVIPFEINSAAETARLQVLTSDRFGRAIAIESVDVILQKVGRNEIYAPEVTQEPYIIRYPDEGQTVSGGKLVIEGLIRPVNDSQVILEAIGEDAAVIFTKQFHVDPPTGELSHTPFQLEIPYKVSAATPVRLIFRQEGSRIPGSVALSSLTIILAP